MNIIVLEETKKRFVYKLGMVTVYILRVKM